MKHNKLHGVGVLALLAVAFGVSGGIDEHAAQSRSKLAANTASFDKALERAGTVCRAHYVGAQLDACLTGALQARVDASALHAAPLMQPLTRRTDI